MATGQGGELGRTYQARWQIAHERDEVHHVDPGSQLER